jgi:hypothetical protein
VSRSFGASPGSYKKKLKLKNTGSSCWKLDVVNTRTFGLVHVELPKCMKNATTKFEGSPQPNIGRFSGCNILPPFLDIRCMVFYRKLQNIRWVVGLWDFLTQYRSQSD